MCSFGRSVIGVSRHPSRSSTFGWFGRSATICEPHLVQNRRSFPGDDSKLDNSSSPRSQRKAARGTGVWGGQRPGVDPLPTGRSAVLVEILPSPRAYRQAAVGMAESSAIAASSLELKTRWRERTQKNERRTSEIPARRP